MKGKNQSFDRWISKARSPYERAFSKLNYRVRYRGIERNQFSAFVHAMAFNLKRIRVLQLEGTGPPLATLSQPQSG
jgi:transposase, IS5 family